MSPIRIKSGDFEIAATGTVITFGDNPVEVFFKALEEELSIVFTFADDKANSNRRMESKLHNGKKLEIKLFNLNGGLDEGNIEPLSIGTTPSGKALYVSFRSSTLSESKSRLLHFTVYLHV